MSSRSMPGDNDVPSNKFHLTSYADLQRRETPLVLRRLIELQHKPILGNFDVTHIQAIHRYLFQDIYGWAGEIRSVTISKPDAMFPPPQHLKPSLDSLFGELAAEGFLKDLAAPAWANRAAYYLGEINAIHPFREGNGRAQREFIRELALANGHSLVWADQTLEEMIDASKRSFLGRDYSALEHILKTSLGIRS
jgi:cell filamentation protein